MKIRVYHGLYGCETGCCGHIIDVLQDDGSGSTGFEFGHWDPKEHPDPRDYARQLAEEYLERRFPSCVPTIDWDSLEYEDITSWMDCRL